MHKCRYWLLFALICLPYTTKNLTAEEIAQALSSQENQVNDAAFKNTSNENPPTQIWHGYNAEVRKERKRAAKEVKKSPQIETEGQTANTQEQGQEQGQEQVAQTVNEPQASNAPFGAISTPLETPATSAVTPPVSSVIPVSMKNPPTRIWHGYNHEVKKERKRQAEGEEDEHHHHHYSSRHTRYEVTPHLHKACHIFLTSEVLYWTTKEEGLDYGMSFFEGGTPTSLVYGKVRNINPEFRIGYRNAIKHELDNSRWDLNLVWTSYANSRDARTRLKPGQVFAAFKLNQHLAPFSNRGAKAHWGIDFNALDFEVGYNLGWKSQFALRPFAGIKAAKIEQRVRVKYLDVTSEGVSAAFGRGERPGVFAPAAAPFVDGNYFTRDHYTSHNYGLRFGMDSQFYAGCGFKIFLNAAVAAIWGKFDFMHNENLERFPKRSVYHNSFDSVNPEFEIAAGFAWQTFFCDKQYYLDFRLGWEQQVWISQNQVYRQVSEIGFNQITTEESDLAFAGPTFSATFGF